MKKIEDKVWAVPVTANQVADYQSKFKVINIQNTGNQVILRILSDEKPDENAGNVPPTLEDYYLYVFET